MSHRLRRIVPLAMAAACATALFGPTALGQQPQPITCPPGSTEVPPPATVPQLQQYWQTKTWVGSATCSMYADMSKSEVDYSGGETHKWEIIPWRICVNAASGMTFFAENWTAVGGGSRAPLTIPGGGLRPRWWQVNAKGPEPGFLQFWVPSGSNLLHIQRWPSPPQTDPNGSTGTLPGPVRELPFPGPVTSAPGVPPVFGPIVANPSNTDTVLGGTPGITTSGVYLLNEPNDAQNHWDCSWDFHLNSYKPVPLGSLKKPETVKK